MDLIELPLDKLMVGMSLNCTLRDRNGMLLLAKGLKIESRAQLDSIRSRLKIFAEIDETDEGIRAMMSGLTKLNHAGGAIKDFSKFLNIKQQTAGDVKLTGTLVERWGTVESQLGGLLASISTTTDCQKKLYLLEKFIQNQVIEEGSATHFLLFNRAVTHFSGYSVLHSLLCATLASSLATTFRLAEDERRSLVCAALTMNVAMTRLQDALAIQQLPPSPAQRNEIENHCAAGRQALTDAGVTDTMWLDIVAKHHAPLEGPEALSDWPPTQRATRILQMVDRYTAAMSPRKSRTGRTARDSARSVIVQAGATKHDEVGTALIGMLGMCPPGTYVKLVNGETAVVMRRGVKPGEPWVASVLNRNDEPISIPRLHDTSREGLGIQSGLIASTVRVNLRMDEMLRLIPANKLS
jgi:HD-GYP domain-containing protein (c-di-GMP phosphodiesterase class II)